ncbi:MAG: DUF3866 family protein, partial [Actinomycetota bacterium]
MAVIRMRTGRVLRVVRTSEGMVELDVEVEGRIDRAIAYPPMTGPVSEGATVQLNTTAVAWGLGTGGHHFVMAVEGQEDLDPSPGGHVMKLRYTPLQVKVEAVEEPQSPHRELLETAESLDGMPVVWVPLHSMVGAVCAGAGVAGAQRVVYVMTDGAALPLWYSRQVRVLREAGLLGAVVTCGQALGGDLEAVNVFSGLLAARAVLRAEVVVVGDGPGKVGTATRWGSSEIAGGLALNVAAILGGRPVAAIRVNFTDPRPRHRGLSIHSLTVLTRVALSAVDVAVPVLEEGQREEVWAALREAEVDRRHHLVEIDGSPAVDLL